MSCVCLHWNVLSSQFYLTPAVVKNELNRSSKMLIRMLLIPVLVINVFAEDPISKQKSSAELLLEALGEYRIL